MTANGQTQKMDTTQTVIWSPGMQLEELEKNVIFSALSFYKGNKTATAHSLGIAVRTLDYKLERYHKDEQDYTAYEKERKQNRIKQLHASRFGRAAAEKAFGATPTGASSNTKKAGANPQSAEELPTEQSLSVQKRKKV